MSGTALNAHSSPLVSRAGLSIVICSYNGEQRIAATLEAIAKCEANFPVEVILVDNGSNDSVVETACAVWRILSSSFDFQVLREPKPGKSNAQKAGVLAAAHPNIVFCDDDNWLESNYLLVASEMLSDSSVGAVSGQAEPVFESPPHPFVYSHGAWLALGIQALTSGDVTNTRGYVWGAGMAVRTCDMLTVYQCPGLPALSGPSGELSTARGEDNELCWALKTLGRRIVYDERLKLKHYMPRDRLDMGYLLRRANDPGPTWDQRVVRMVNGLDTLRGVRGRIFVALKSALRWLRHFRWPEEQRHHAFMLLAACGLTGCMDEVERRLYIASQWLRSVREKEFLATQS